MAADINAVIDIFSAHRLLVIRDGTASRSLMTRCCQAWKQLRDWLGDDQLDRALYSQVVTDAATWESNRRDSSYLYRPGRLATIDAATARWQDAPARYSPVTGHPGGVRPGAAHHAARRSTRRRQGAFAILVLLTALAVTASVVAVYQRSAAGIRQRDQAIYNQVIAEALQYGTSDTTLAAQLNLAAYRIRPTQDLSSRLLNTESRSPILAPGRGRGGHRNSVAFSAERAHAAGGRR